ncbi:MAG: polyphosphate kinase 1 [Acidobacteriota bacterium]
MASPDQNLQGTTAGAAPATEPTALSLEDPALYLDREHSLLLFQHRVLEEARDAANPLLERVKFLSILFSNLDEFYMVRFAVLKQKAGSLHDSLIAERLDRLRADVRDLMTAAQETWRELELALMQEGIDVREYTDLGTPERQSLDEYFRETVFPVLTPLAFDSGRPFPHISNLSLNLAVALRDEKGAKRFARVKVPDTLPQLVFVRTPEKAEQDAQAGRSHGVHPPIRPTVVWLEDMIRANLEALFPGLEIIAAYPFRVTRDAEVEVQEVESDDLLETVEEAVWQRRFRAVVRLQVSSQASGNISRQLPPDLLDVLLKNLELDRRDVYEFDGPLDLGRLRELLAVDRPDLKDPPFLSYTPPALSVAGKDDIFAVLRRGDVLLHHPFESFQPVAEFLRTAALDPDVLAIKITLYRVGPKSPIVESLLTAIEQGKQVSVLVELKARFDEESNIEWAKSLEAAGVHVVYGLMGLKVHSKVAMVVRREGHKIRRYVHLGTGNYNPSTSRLYTDLSFLTTDEEIAADATDLFNFVTGYSAKKSYRKLLVAPVTLLSRMEELIERETEHARHGESARIIMKMNSLEDPSIIRALYRASQAGVQLDLLVRGVCCLRPGVPGISENIRVTSIVGRFLEHSRVYYFRNAGAEEIYLGSADMMGRNLYRRVEVLFPIENPRLQARVLGILNLYLEDTRNARHMLSDGTYVHAKAKDGEVVVSAQARFLAGALR